MFDDDPKECGCGNTECGRCFPWANARKSAMKPFRVRAQWWGPNGAQVGVADDTVEAEDACHAATFAVPVEYQVGVFTHATITIEPLPPKSED